MINIQGVQWRNADIKDKRKAVVREKQRRKNLEKTDGAKDEVEKSIRWSKSQMCSDFLHNLRGAEVWRVPSYTNPQASMIVEALMGREAMQGNTAAEKQEMLRQQSFPPNYDDQYKELHPAGSPPTHVTEHAVVRSLFA